MQLIIATLETIARQATGASRSRLAELREHLKNVDELVRTCHSLGTLGDVDSIRIHGPRKDAGDTITTRMMTIFADAKSLIEALPGDLDSNGRLHPIINHEDLVHAIGVAERILDARISYGDAFDILKDGRTVGTAAAGSISMDRRLVRLGDVGCWPHDQVVAWSCEDGLIGILTTDGRLHEVRLVDRKERLRTQGDREDLPKS